MGVSGDGTCDASQLSPFGLKVDEAIREHAVQEFPNECCGIVVKGKYIPAKNVHPNPTSYFEIDPELLQTFATPEIEGLVHSHSKVMPWPSKMDMEQQELWDIPWAIASVTYDGINPPFCMDLFWFGDTLPRLPLLNRQFRPSIQDCYALARDHYFQSGIELPVMPRDHAWWTDDEETGRKRENLFVDLLDASGFQMIDFDQVKPGDGFACAYGTSTICHCGVLLDFDFVLHHLTDHKSSSDRAERWIQRTLRNGKFFRVRHQ